MFNPVRSRFALAVGVLCAMSAMSAVAGPSVEDSLALSMSKGIRDRMFWNLQVVTARTKTKSEEPRDITPGGVVKIADLKAMATWYEDRYGFDQVDPATATYEDAVGYYKYPGYKLAAESLGGAILADNPGQFASDDEAYLATPKGILARSGNPSATLALSVGYYFDEERRWFAEAVVLGVPLRVSVYGDGVKSTGGVGTTPIGSAPNTLSGKEILTTKMLPPIVRFGYQFGDRTWSVRPYAGVAGMYAMFFDTKATPFFQDYQGGKTTVNLKNALGVGPVLGLNTENVGDTGWNIGFSIGMIRLKTEATLVTRGTTITSKTDVTNDYGGNVVNAIKVIGEQDIVADARAIQDYFPGQSVYPEGFTTELLRDLARYKKEVNGQGDGATLGTFVRKQRSTLDNTIFMLSVGRSF